MSLPSYPNHVDVRPGDSSPFAVRRTHLRITYVCYITERKICLGPKWLRMRFCLVRSGVTTYSCWPEACQTLKFLYTQNVPEHLIAEPRRVRSFSFVHTKSARAPPKNRPQKTKMMPNGFITTKRDLQQTGT